tara:strand:- start:7046 stop:7747 length:702 start_codon:yes stop_codon:yes gene_type:complete
MISKNSFKSYFLVSNEEISIYVKNTSNSEIIFFKKKKITNDSDNFFERDVQPFFLEKIEQVESQIKLFIDDTVLIVDDKSIFSIGLSLKQKIENRKITEEELKNLLSNGLQQIYTQNPNHLIIHYIIDQFNIDGETIENPAEKMISNYLSINLRFICIEKKLADRYKNLFKKKQILLEKIISLFYLKEYEHDEEGDLISIASKIENGYNKNEIKLIPKKVKKRGFFENFFLSI